MSGPRKKKDQHHLRIVCPGVVSSLVASPDGMYCIAGIAEKIYVWQISTGNLLAVVSRHYQTVTCLRITDDGSHFVSGGDDNLVMVWSLASVLQEGQSTQGVDPVHIWSNHSLPVTDLHCTTGGMMARVASASQDHTCKVWDMCSGELLCNFVFDVPLNSVCMDPAEYRLFAGAMNGTVYQVNLFESNSSRERHIKVRETGEDEDTTTAVFAGHSKPVTCLSVSLDGSMLVSGSQDQTVCIWHIQSKQCVRTINHKGAVTNAMIIPTPPNLQSSQTKPTLPIQVFKRHLHVPNQWNGLHSSTQSSRNGSDRHTGTVAVKLKGTKSEATKVSTSGTNLSEAELESLLATINQERSSSSSEADIENLSAKELHQRLQQVQQLNKDIFTYATKQILNTR
ncbi:WD repeat-containing protein 18-like [Amphiura filiformis]|uniref:WD repeat-containing protein 18-like n=1 Tax=Amphiura filiformis TaxID=82378 RepID=UPI003B211084